jgi:hypothetical protein
MSGRVCHSLKAWRTTWRISIQRTLRQRWPCLTPKQWLASIAVPNGSPMVQIVAISPSWSRMAS